MIGAQEDIIERARSGELEQQQHTHELNKQQPRAIPHPLIHNRPYDATERTAAVSCSPAEVHFRVVVPGQPQEQVVQLRNIAAAPTRVSVVPPSGPHFKVALGEAKGWIAPGLSQQLVVQFTGGSMLEHYTDCIHVHTEDGGLLVPLHAYPVMTHGLLPKRLDLGDAELGGSTSAELVLPCEAGAAFDFHVTILQHNKHFAVAPMAGSVPPHGCAAVVVTFTPTRYSMERLQLQVAVSEQGAQPMPVEVTGRCRPGLVHERILAAAEAGGPDQQQLEQWQQDVCKVQPAMQGHSGQLSTSQHPDGRSQPVAQRKPPRHGTAATCSGGSSPKPARLPDVLLEKPGRITQHDVNRLLNQRPGRLQVKDIKAAIAVRKEQMAVERQHLQAALDAGAAAGVDPLEQPDLSPRVKAALFQMQLEQSEAGARHCQGGAQVGASPPTAEELQRMVAAREAALQQAEASAQAAARHRLNLSMQPTGAVHILPEQPTTRGAGPCSSSGSNSGSSYPGLEGFQPQWLLLSEGNDWRKRVQAAQRFVNAVRVVVYRNRAQARLDKLKALQARLQGRRDSLTGQALQEVVLESSMVSRPGLPPAQLMVPDRVRLSDLPPTNPEGWCQQQQQQVEEGVYADYSSLQAQPYQAEFQYVLDGHRPEEFPGLLAYVPLCADQPLLPGAAEDGLQGLS